MRYLVTGDRNWRNAMVVMRVLQDVLSEDLTDEVPILIHGDAKGADTVADICWQLLGYGDQIERYPADWKVLGNRAGPVRNKKMLETGVDKVIAFHNDLANSKGTKNMVLLAEEAGVDVKVYSEAHNA
jgi:hypothetical protein